MRFWGGRTLAHLLRCGVQGCLGWVGLGCVCVGGGGAACLPSNSRAWHLKVPSCEALLARSMPLLVLQVRDETILRSKDNGVLALRDAGEVQSNPIDRFVVHKGSA